MQVRLYVYHTQAYGFDQYALVFYDARDGRQEQTIDENDFLYWLSIGVPRINH